MRLLLQSYMRLSDDAVDHQDRGYQLEKIINVLLVEAGLEVVEGFSRNSGAEQIDGGFRLDGWHYLVECKWTTARTSVKELDSLSGKVGRSGFQTMGLFISVNGWSRHVVPELKRERDKKIMLMNGEDVRAALEGRIPLVNLLRNKLSGLNLRSEPYVGFDESC